MKLILIAPILFISTYAIAQQGSVAGGGNATGGGGSASYSVGQTVWNMYTASSGSVLQGVQQPYEISIVSGNEEYEVDLTYVVFPNPTGGNVTLDVGDTDLNGLKYQLYSVSGVTLQEKNIETTESVIYLEPYPSSTYFLRIVKGQLVIKVFKIIKN